MSESGAESKAIHVVPRLADRFRSVSQTSSKQLAVEHGTRSLTYAQLDAYSDSLAAELASHDLGHAPIGVLATRSVEMVVAVLAAIKLGCGYVPLDPMYPAERLRYMLSNSGARVLLAHDELVSLIDGYTGVVLSLTERASFSAPAEPSSLPALGELAYVIYTSGSTGQPKGVEMGQGALAHLIDWQLRNTVVAEGGRTLQFSPLSFDVSFQEIFATLCSGGTLVLIDAELRLDSPRLRDFLIAQRIERLFLPFVALQALAECSLKAAGFHLKEVITAGEQLVTTPALQQFFRNMPGCRLYNHYGPSETHVVTSYPLPANVDEWAPLPPIGSAVDGALLYILDEQLKPVQSGESGELYVGGALVANGYAGREDLTKERFLPDPWVAGGRMYKTGDLVRALADGALEYLGRLDTQVKIRGFRVELGEVESAILRHPHVTQVAVTDRQDGDKPKRLVAYIVSKPGHTIKPNELRAHLAPLLPDYMWPSAYVYLEELPRTPSGKIDRRALPAPGRTRPELSAAYVAPGTDLERSITQIWSELLEIDDIGVDDDFFELGGTSLLALRFVRLLAERTGHEPGIAQLFGRTTPRSLTALLEGKDDEEDLLRSALQRRQRMDERGGLFEPIAIVGWAGRFPGADDVGSLLELLTHGREGVTFFSANELDPSIPESLKNDSSYVRARGTIRGPELFDAELFGISPREAQMIDPQQRQLLECSWLALENSGLDPQSFSGPIGVFAGVMNNTYYGEQVLKNPKAVEGFGEFNAMTANEKDYVATRVSYRLNLTGPSVSVHTACSTSLVAVHLACQSLRLLECDVALAGGASVNVPVASGYIYNEGGMLSADGHCRSFDAAASGTTFGDGVGVVVLKRLSDAQRDGDVIHAVIRGSAINNDGAQKASFTAPSLDGQARAITSALAAAGVSPDTIQYVEAHGTATPIGDPIEVAALVKAYGEKPGGAAACALGSIKSNMGHLTAAAGVAGVIKASLSLEHRTLFPTVHFKQLNPAINLGGRFFVSAETAPFPRSEEPRRAAVSSMGVGGTNAHVILEEAPPVGPSGPSRPFQTLVFSARNEAALRQHLEDIKQHLSAETDVSLPDVAYTLATGRRAFRRRAAFSAANVTELITEFDKCLAKPSIGVDATPRQVVFVFPGQGTQYPRMGMGLYDTEPAFRAAMDQCAEAVAKELSVPLLDVIRSAAQDDVAAAERLQETQFAQPAIFAVEYSLAQLALSVGMKPVAALGHSVGEFVAATLAGVFRLEDAIRLVAIRGRAMQQMPPGAMLSVRETPERVREFLVPETELAAINGKKLVVAAGPDAALSELENKLQAAEIPAKRLRTSHAFHTWMMDEAVGLLRDAITRIELKQPRLPFVSTATGEWITDAQAADPEYWAQHLRRTVLFSQALQTLWKTHPAVLLELGPAGTLPALARQSLDGPAAVFSAMGPVGDAASEQRSWSRCLGNIWEQGVPHSTNAVYRHETRRKVELPPRPLLRKRYWLDVSPNYEASTFASRSGVTSAESTNPQPSTNSLTATPRGSSPILLTEPSNTMSSSSPQRSAIVNEVRQLLEDASGLTLGEFDEGAHFTEMGLDSLLLTQAALTFKKQFGVPVTFRQLSDDLSNLGALSDYVLEHLPAERKAALGGSAANGASHVNGQSTAVTVAAVTAASAPAAIATATPSAVATVVPGASFTQATPISQPIALAPVSDANGVSAQLLVQQQLQLMARQLEFLQGAALTPVVAPQLPNSIIPQPAPAQPEAGATETREQAAPPASQAAAEPAAAPAAAPKTFGAQTRIDTTRRDYDPNFKDKLAAFLERYQAKTRRSKEYSAKHRSHLADPRVVSGFRPAIKEAVYPIVVERSKGARLWDIDGNEYIDITCGFGTNFLGHSPDFVMEAIKEQMERGVEIGPQNPLAGEVAQLMAEMAGLDRVALCNTGSEAVLGAMRLARTVTGNSLIVMFNGAYHGIVDEVIVRGTPSLKSFPAAPGIPAESVANTLILDYGDPKSLQIIRDRIDELAAVLVEPVQSRHPDLQPTEFLKEVRAITEQAGVALIFDEVITGFRSCQGGAQEHFGIRADLATYGKIIGGGMPIGAIGGKRKFMDALDGGQWQYGDDSIPEIGVTYFAGTFVRHPIALAASKAALTYIKTQGTALHERVNGMTKRLVDTLNTYFGTRGYPIHIERFGSLYKIHVEDVHPLAALYFHALRLRGLHVWEARPTFITCAHTDEDVDAIAAAFTGAAADMADLGVFPKPAAGEQASAPPVPGARLGRDRSGQPAWFKEDPQRPGKYIQVVID
jgi:amino acid adenylation domain-containing protein